MIDADIHEAGVVDDVIDAVRSRLAISQVDEVVHVDNSVFPFGCHSLPLFLKLPMSSFFLQSTEIIGSPLRSKASQVCLMWRNWRSRSGCDTPRCFSCWPSERTPGCP